MALDWVSRSDGQATFVGFGFGPIQAGLFLLEAQRSRAFRHLVVAEVMPEVVAAVRGAGGHYAVNVAHADRVETVTVGPVALEDPAVYADRARLVEAIAAAREIATAVPSVKAYRGGGAAALNRVLADGLLRKVVGGGPPAVVYAAENTPHAAAQLHAAVMEEIPENERAAVNRRVAFVDTVIAKMSGMGTPADGLTPVTPRSDRAFLVEAFNHILVTRPDFGFDAPPFLRGLTVFEEKEDLQPYEEAKLYGHNAVHALAAYLGIACGATTLAELAQEPGMLAFLRAALVEESGAGLCHRYGGPGGLTDPLFTPEGFACFADDLLARMVNPHLRDSVARVGRDPARKLGWDDRLVGAMRLARAAGITPDRYALGVAAAFTALDPNADPAVRLLALWWDAGADPEEAAAILSLVQTARGRLRAWRTAGCPDLTAWWAAVTPAR